MKTLVYSYETFWQKFRAIDEELSYYFNFEQRSIYVFIFRYLKFKNKYILKSVTLFEYKIQDKRNIHGVLFEKLIDDGTFQWEVAS